MNSYHFNSYKILLHTDQTTLHRGEIQESGLPAILKVSHASRTDHENSEKQLHEYKIASQLKTDEILKPFGTTVYQGSPAILFEEFNGIPLVSFLGSPMETEVFLRMSVPIAEAVSEIHTQNVIHNNLNPENILVQLNEDSFHVQVKINGFDIASLLSHEQAKIKPLNQIEGSLPFLSPEQTGRMNRDLDRRSDLYSLGVLLYQMLTGRLPFEASDPLEWIYCHVARNPPDPSLDVPQIPDVLSKIVLKLLAKDPDERYQSARGLAEDLKECLARWRTSGKISPFPLDKRVISGALEFPQKLYGRKEEVTQLLGGFERTTTLGTPELILITGYSGIGKSTLAQELIRSIVQKRGFFIQGKSDQYQRSVPYSTLASPFQDLILEILSKSEKEIFIWREDFQNSLGSNAQLIIDLIPQLEIILGKQPPVPQLPLTESKARFQLVFQRFAQLFGTKDHPVVLFLDDLQWADPGSLDLLQSILTHPNTKYFLALGAYRSNEVPLSHPLMTTLENIRKEGVQVHSIFLKSLQVKDLTQFIADTFHSEFEPVEELAQLIHSKTDGNPFFVIQFLTTLYQDQLIQFDPSYLKWCWNLTQIAAQNYTDNVVNLMIDRINRLAEKTRYILKYAAFCGESISASILSAATNQSEEFVNQALLDTVKNGLMFQLNRNHYRFLHDRIQQAAYELTPEEQRPKIHCTIGRILLTQFRRNPDFNRHFEIATHMIKGASLITDPNEKQEAAQFLFDIGCKSKSFSAYKSASLYFSEGIHLLSSNPWENQYDLSYGLHFELAECEWLNGNFKRTEHLLAVLRFQARTNIEKLKIAGIQVNSYMIQSQFKQAIESGLEALKLIGIQLSIHPAEEVVDLAYSRVLNMLKQRSIESLSNLSRLKNPEVNTALYLMTLISDPAMHFNISLANILICEIVIKSICYGNSESSAFGYASFGLLLIDHDSYSEAYRFGAVAQNLVKHPGRHLIQTKVIVYIEGTINYWFKPYRAGIPLLEEAARAGLELGDILWSSYSSNLIVLHSFLSSEPLSELDQKIERHLDSVRRVKAEDFANIIISIQRGVQSLRGISPCLSNFRNEKIDVQTFEQIIEKKNIPFATFVHNLFKLKELFIFGNDELCRIVSAKIKSALSQVNGATIPEYYFYEGLLIASSQMSSSPRPPKEQMDLLLDYESKFRLWAKNCLENFGTKHALLSAEIARISGKGFEAGRLYEQAIRLAQAGGLLHCEAIANEIAARFYRDQGIASVANQYLLAAHRAYHRWGADAKVKQMEDQFPQLLRSSEVNPVKEVPIQMQQLDLLSILKASHSISGEIDLNNLIRQLIQVVLESSGAQKADLFLLEEGKLNLKAEATSTLDQEIKTTVFSKTSPSAIEAPESILHYVWRTQETVQLDDARDLLSRGKFHKDEYLARAQPKSVFCLPIIKGRKMIGALYLENNFVTYAFTPKRVLVLNLLAAQAAISLEVAYLIQKEQDARTRAETALQSRDEFMEIAAHEFRTPLTPLKIQISLVKNLLKNENLQIPTSRMNQIIALFDKSEIQLNKVSSLLDDFLNTSKIEEGHIPLELKPMDLAELVQEVVERYRLQAAQAKCEITFHTEGQMIGSWDRSRIEQVLTNLVTNAIKFGAKKPIEIHATRKKDHVLVKVQDHGIGIDKKDQSRIFNRFQRATSVENFGGFGLGLYISRVFVEAHGGKMGVTSQLGVGSTFWFTLPLNSAGNSAHISSQIRS